MPLTQTDILKAALACAATIAATLLWVHRSSQTKVSRSLGSSSKIAIRILLIGFVSVALLCEMFGVPINILLGVLPFVLLITYVVSLDSAPHAAPFDFTAGMDDPLSFAIGMTVIVPFYVLKQFVLGFPDRDLVILVPPSIPVSSDPPPHASETGNVVATLRPMGRIELAGEQFSATSANGTMITIGSPIRVCGHRNGQFLVAMLEDEESEIAS